MLHKVLLMECSANCTRNL